MSSPIVRKGASAALAKSQSGNFVGVRENEKLEFAPLTSIDEIVSFDQHVFWGEEPENTVMFPCLQEKSCPGCLLGNKPRLRVLLLVAYRNDEGAVTAGILPVGLSVLRNLVDLDTMSPGGIKNKMMVLGRLGSGLKTRYTLMATGYALKKVPESDINIEDSIGETNRDVIISMLQESGNNMGPIVAFDEASARIAKKAAIKTEAPLPTKASPEKKGRKQKPEPEVESFEDEEVEDVDLEDEETDDWA